jgi:hypothetical protein
MAARKITGGNIVATLTDWFVSPTNRGDTLYFLNSELDAKQIQQQAFYKGLLISISAVDQYTSQITFVNVLT